MRRSTLSVNAVRVTALRGPFAAVNCESGRSRATPTTDFGLEVCFRGGEASGFFGFGSDPCRLMRANPQSATFGLRGCFWRECRLGFALWFFSFVRCVNGNVIDFDGVFVFLTYFIVFCRRRRVMLKLL